MPWRTFVPVSNLAIDLENPRFSEKAKSQNEAIATLAATLEKKLLVLAKDILAKGINFTFPPIVMKDENSKHQYIVLEGNRRVAILKLLENPELIEAKLPEFFKQLKKLGEQFALKPIQELECTVVDSREEAAPWIELIHTGEREGAGIVKWDPEEVGRFSSRNSKLPIELQALDFLQHEARLSVPDRKKVHTSTLRRLLNTPEVREHAGLEWKDGTLNRMAAKGKVANSLKAIVTALNNGEMTSRQLNSKDDRLAFLKSLPASSRVPHALAEPVGLTDGPENEKRIKNAVAATRSKPKPMPWNKVVPKGFRINISVRRIADIFEELEELDIQQFPNSTGVLLRVFLEMSVAHFLTKHRLQAALEAQGKPNRKIYLSEKILFLTDELEKNRKRLTKTQGQALRRFCQGDSLLAPTINDLNLWVHNAHTAPSPRDLKTIWTNYEPLVVEIWR